MSALDSAITNCIFSAFDVFFNLPDKYNQRQDNHRKRSLVEKEVGAGRTRDNQVILVNVSLRKSKGEGGVTRTRDLLFCETFCFSFHFHSNPFDPGMYLTIEETGNQEVALQITTQQQSKCIMNISRYTT